jgi:small subunit ribosomal protein S6
LRLYEAMFIVDHNLARTNYEDVEKQIHGVITRFEGEVKQSLRWAERKLAYPLRANMKKHEKAAYILVHFESDPTAVVKMDRQFRLSETVIRHMIVRDEDGLFDPEQMHSELFEPDAATESKPEDETVSPENAPEVAADEKGKSE